MERKQKDLVIVLKKLVGENLSDWPNKLMVATFALNQAVSATTKFSPNELMFTYEVRSCTDLIFDTTSTEFYASHEHFKMDSYYHYRSVFDLVRSNITDSLKLQKRIYDKQTNFTKYQVGDKVLLFRPIPAKIKDNRKLHSSFSGPHIIIQSISEHNFLIENCSDKKQQVVHHDALRLMKRKETAGGQTDGKTDNKSKETGQKDVIAAENKEESTKTTNDSEEDEEENTDQEDDQEETNETSDLHQDNSGQARSENEQLTFSKLQEDNDKLLDKMAEEDSDQEEEITDSGSAEQELTDLTNPANFEEVYHDSDADVGSNHSPNSEMSHESNTIHDSLNSQEESLELGQEDCTKEKIVKEQSTTESSEDEPRRSSRTTKPPIRFTDQYNQLYGRK